MPGQDDLDGRTFSGKYWVCWMVIDGDHTDQGCIPPKLINPQLAIGGWRFIAGQKVTAEGNTQSEERSADYADFADRRGESTNLRISE